jgi:DNA-binding MarR family transcriptional regulator
MTDQGAKRGFDSREQEVFLNLWRTYDRLKKFEEDLFDAHGLTAQQYNALRVLRSVHPGTMPTLTLAGRLISRAPDITRLIDKLETRGLVRRDRPAGNRRVVNLAITDEGIDLLKKLARPVRECGLRQLGHLTEEQKSQLVGLLEAARRPHTDEGDW